MFQLLFQYAVDGKWNGNAKRNIWNISVRDNGDHDTDDCCHDGSLLENIAFFMQDHCADQKCKNGTKEISKARLKDMSAYICICARRKVHKD